MVTLKKEPGIAASSGAEFSDHAASGYVRVGDVQICWGGAGSYSSGGIYFTYFPVSFVDTNIYLVGTCACETGYRVMRREGLQTNGWYSQSRDISNAQRSNQPGAYIAIGKWR